MKVGALSCCLLWTQSLKWSAAVIFAEVMVRLIRTPVIFTIVLQHRLCSLWLHTGQMASCALLPCLWLWCSAHPVGNACSCLPGGLSHPWLGNWEVRYCVLNAWWCLLVFVYWMYEKLIHQEKQLLPWAFSFTKPFEVAGFMPILQMLNWEEQPWCGSRFVWLPGLSSDTLVAPSLFLAQGPSFQYQISQTSHRR